MGAGESGKYKRSTVGLALMYLHSGETLITSLDGRHIGEVKLRIHAVGIHIHGHRYQIHITGSLTVSKQGTFYPVCACQYAQLCVSHAAASVVVRMDGKHHVVTIFDVLADVLDLAGKYVRHGGLHRCRNIHDDLPVRSGLPYVQHGVAHIKGIVHLCAVEGLRAVLEGDVAFLALGQLLQKLGAIHSDLHDLFPGLLKYLLPLCHGCRIVQMYHHVGCSLDGLEGLADDVLSCLGQHLDRHILGDHIILDQCS